MVSYFCFQFEQLISPFFCVNIFLLNVSLFLAGEDVSGLKSQRDMTIQDIVDECGGYINTKSTYILINTRVLALAGAKHYLMGRNETQLQEISKNIINLYQHMKEYNLGVKYTFTR